MNAAGRRPDVIVVGGGLAGIAAAVRLSEAGARVRLVETRKKLGGRATSFTDVRTGDVLDNCQHVLLGCCANYRDLLGRIGASSKIAWTREQYWVEEGGRESVIGPGLLPAPGHFGGSVLRAAFLSSGDKLRLARAVLALLRAGREREHDSTFASWLARHGQGERVIRRFWSPVVVSACNLDVDRVSAASAIHVFQEGFLATRHAADMGVPRVPLVELYERVPEIIEAAGGAVLLGRGAARIGARLVETTGGERLEAERVVCAVPVERVNRMIDAADRAGDRRFDGLDGFAHSPIVGVHLVFDRGVLDRPHCVLVERGTQWLFRKDDAGARIHAVISAADEWVALSEEQILGRVAADVRACLPAARAATLVSGRVVKEKLATFAPTPGADRARPATEGPSGVVLAGDYVATGWPATMEGATRSGYMAAAAVLGVPESRLLAPPIRPEPLARMLGLHKAGGGPDVG